MASPSQGKQTSSRELIMLFLFVRNRKETNSEIDMGVCSFILKTAGHREMC